MLDKKKTYVFITVVAVCFSTLILLVLTNSPAHANDDNENSCPVVLPIVNTVYVDRPVIQNLVHTVEIPVQKIVKIEIPVYETMTVTSDVKTIRSMMKVTHDRYVVLLAKYRELMKAKKGLK